MPRRPTKVMLALAAVRKSFEAQRPLAVKDALGIIHEAQFLLAQERNMVALTSRAITFVFGDIHGQFFDLMQILDAVGGVDLEERDVQLLFLGDYVDRGVFSCEVMLFLLLLKVRFPTKVVLLRGNHECESISSFYGFRNECRVKYGISVYHHFLSCFQALPVAAVLETPRGGIFFVHGGISPDLPSLESIQAIDRRREIPTVGPLCDLLWADPATEEREPGGDDDVVATSAMWNVNEVRGCSYYFNAPATFEFLEKNGLLSVVRAHEYEDEGFMFHFHSERYEPLDQRQDKAMPPLITVFSAPNYCDRLKNCAGYLILHEEPFSWEVKQIETAGHPTPALAISERGSDMWRQFNETLPFLPASKEFFEQILWLADKEKAVRRAGAADPKPVVYKEEIRHASLALGVENEDPTARRRRQTSEMHPQAIRRVLDEEVDKWSHTDELKAEGPEEATAAKMKRVESLPNMANKGDDRCNTLTTQELEMMKLMFSLMDTDGSMTLSAPKVSQFIFNILGEKISSADADKYLDALDYDRNGVVDFGDILSWAAVMKANEQANDAFGPLSWCSLRSGVRWLVREVDVVTLCLWLALCCLLRDVFVQKHRRLIKSSSARLLGSISLAVYTMGLLSGRNSLGGRGWARVAPLQRVISCIKRRMERE